MMKQDGDNHNHNNRLYTPYITHYRLILAIDRLYSSNSRYLHFNSCFNFPSSPFSLFIHCSPQPAWHARAHHHHATPKEGVTTTGRANGNEIGRGKGIEMDIVNEIGRGTETGKETGKEKG